MNRRPANTNTITSPDSTRATLDLPADRQEQLPGRARDEGGTMKQVHTRRELMTVGAAVAAVAIAGPSASAQTTMTTEAPATPKAKKTATSAKQEIIDEDIQRSVA